jgi:N-acetylneuraminic acid mutarotase
MKLSKRFFLVLFMISMCLLGTSASGIISYSENTWVNGSQIPQAISGGRAVAVDGKIYVIGVSSDFKKSLNYEYDPATDKWAPKASMPTPRMWFAAAVYQGKIYTIGGYDWNNGNPIVLDSNEVYDPTVDTWQTKQPMPTARQELDANVISDQIFLIGGLRSSDGPTHAVALNEVYNVSNDSWSAKEPMLYPAASYASAVSSAKIYCMGKSDFMEGNNRFFTQVYDPSNDSWSLGTPMPSSLRGCTACATTGELALRRIYLIGGYPDGSTDYLPVSTVQVYNPENNTWTYGTPMPTARCFLTVANLDDKLYAMAGSPCVFPDPLFRDVQDRYNEIYTPFGYGAPNTRYVLEHTPPNITLDSSLNGMTSTNSSVPLVFSADKELDWVGYSLDGQANVTLSGNCTLTGLSGGSHSLRVFANDTFGNMGVSEPLIFSVELFPLAFVVVGVLVVAVVGVVAGVVVFFKKRR